MTEEFRKQRDEGMKKYRRSLMEKGKTGSEATWITYEWQLKLHGLSFETVRHIVCDLGFYDTRPRKSVKT